MTGRSSRESRRLFFALVPDARTREAILRATRTAVTTAHGRTTVPSNLHITVAFLGNIEPGRMAAARRAVPPVPACFDMTLGRYTHRRGMLWLVPLAVPEPLIALEHSLWDGLQRQGFERERRAYRPHFTLARDIESAADGGLDIRWRVDALHLMESIGGASGPRYVSIGTWPFTAPKAP